VTVRWLGETPSFRWLGLPPDSCFSKPGFTDCFAHSISFANAVCQAQPAEVRGDCVQYNADLYAYNNCKQFCPEISAPIRPASFPEGGAGGSSPGGGRATPNAQPSSGAPDTGGGGGALILAAAAIVAVVIVANLT